MSEDNLSLLSADDNGRAQAACRSRVIVTLAGTEVEKSRVDVVTLPQTAWAWIATPRTVAAALGDPAEITTVAGAPVLAGEVVKVERSRRHQRIIARPVALVDMIRRMVDPVTLQDQTVPALLAAVMGGAPGVTVLPPLDSSQLPFWSTRTRSQRWCLLAVLRALRHNSVAVAWRFDARGDLVTVFSPGGDEQRPDHTVDDALLARGGAVELSAVRYAVQAGDTLSGAKVQRVDTTWMHRRKRSLVYTA